MDRRPSSGHVVCDMRATGDCDHGCCSNDSATSRGSEAIVVPVYVGYLVLVGIAAISFIFALTVFPDVRPNLADASIGPTEAMDAL